MRQFLSMAVLTHSTLQCKPYYWRVRDTLMLCSVLLSSCIGTFVGATASTPTGGGREKGTLRCLKEISYISGAFPSPNHSKQIYFHTFPK